VLPFINCTVLALTVAALMALLNVTVIGVERGTLVAPLGGLKAVTVGGVVSIGPEALNNGSNQ
jgi:hypothetical protein